MTICPVELIIDFIALVSCKAHLGIVKFSPIKALQSFIRLPLSFEERI